MKRMKRLLQVAGVAGTAMVGLGTTAMGCLNRPIDRLNPKTTSTVVEELRQSGVDKIDLVLAIDNSISMADKQQILAAAVPDLVNRLITPNCVDDMGVANGEVVDAAGKCGDGFKPEFPPIRNINIGVLSSSLGDLTSDACSSTQILNRDDKGQLLTRTKTGTDVQDFQGKGFLGWDPDNQRGGQTNPTTLTTDLREMVVGVDQVGCGYEMQLESVVRFLVDPNPYKSLAPDPDKENYLMEVDTDEVVLAQRKDFLRPDSLLAVIILSDENDCSIDPHGQGFLALGSPFYRATSECEGNPNDECCTSCGLGHSGCDAGNNCATPKYTSVEDNQNLKCYRQKERYGVNFLYPLKRYVNAFTRAKIDGDDTELDGDKDQNPIFSDLSGSGGGIRSTDLVFVAGIVGVPWQAIAKKNDSGDPDLTLGFKNYEELADDIEYLIGQPEVPRKDGDPEFKDPGEPFMIESMTKRTGTSALTGASLPGTNPINGSDYTVAGGDDLQYACIFPLTDPVTPGADCEDCTGPECDNPLCDGTTQNSAKAYPGIRELGVLAGLGAQGIFASICPAEVQNTSSPIYGYRPAVNTIVDRLKEQLGGQCLPQTLTVDPETGEVPCLVIEARVTPGECNCTNVGGRVDIPKELDGEPNPSYNAVVAAQQSSFANPDWNCFCQIQQVQDEGADACLSNPDPDASAQGDGWCYIDATTVPPIGDPSLVADCPDNERRLVRFVGEGDPQTGATVFVTCSGE